MATKKRAISFEGPVVTSPPAEPASPKLSVTVDIQAGNLRQWMDEFVRNMQRENERQRQAEAVAHATQISAARRADRDAAAAALVASIQARMLPMASQDELRAELGLASLSEAHEEMMSKLAPPPQMENCRSYVGDVVKAIEEKRDGYFVYEKSRFD